MPGELVSDCLGDFVEYNAAGLAAMGGDLIGRVRQGDGAVRQFLVCLVVMLVSALPALSASSDCVSDDEVEASTRIAACTRMIEDATEPLENRGIAYFKRGNALTERGDYDRAIADYSAFIGIAPTVASGYYNRGISWVFKGDYDKGIADLDKAISLDPKYGGRLLQSRRRLDLQGRERPGFGRL
ncbi:tetratricopeptide repeat protein [Mesorhizobium sp. M1088]|uniref:tetratricopeptide repeat protein n=1 Tax=Mesorhizobium sp. M1088 TaxID=2957056 RepID=UPI00333DF689